VQKSWKYGAWIFAGATAAGGLLKTLATAQSVTPLFTYNWNDRPRCPHAQRSSGDEAVGVSLAT